MTLEEHGKQRTTAMAGEATFTLSAKRRARRVFSGERRVGLVKFWEWQGVRLDSEAKKF